MINGNSSQGDNEVTKACQSCGLKSIKSGVRLITTRLLLNYFKHLHKVVLPMWHKQHAMVQGPHQGKLKGGRNWSWSELQSKVLSVHNWVIADEGSCVSNSKLSLPVFAWNLGENWIDTNVKVPYPITARKGFSLLLILLGPHPQAPPVCRPSSCREPGPQSSSGSPGSIGSIPWATGSMGSNLMKMNEWT